MAFFVVQPWAWVWRRPQRPEQQGRAWQIAVTADTCHCVGTVGPGTDPSRWQGYLREKGELLRPGGKHRASRPGPWPPQQALATCWMVLDGAGCLCRALTDRSVPLSNKRNLKIDPRQLPLL